MAQILTERTEYQARQVNKTPNIVLKIEGIEEAFGSQDVFTFIRYGENSIKFGDDIVYGGIVLDLVSQDAVDLTGSSTTITQQLVQDRGSVQSVTNLDIELQDPNGELTERINDETFTQDILGRSAEIAYMFQGGSYPEDSIILLNGVITDVEYLPTTIKLKISHPVQFLRQRIAEPTQHELTGAIDSAVTTIPVSGQFLEPATDFRTFVRINDEVIEYTSTTATTLLGATRGTQRTSPQAHEEEDDVDSFYMLEGTGIDIALKLLLSNPLGGSIDSFTPDNFVDAREAGQIPNSFFVLRRNLIRELGVTTGDTYILAAKPGTAADPYTDQGIIQDVVFFDSGTYVITQTDTGSLVGDPEDYFIQIRSQFDVWPFGLGLKPSQVDIGGFLRIQEIFSADFPQMEVYVTDAINATDFIASELMVPNGLYLIPKKGRVSLGRTSVPLTELGTIELDEDTIVNPDRIKIKRGINKNFYNAVIYKYDIDSLENKLINNLAIISADSTQRIKFPNKPYVIEAAGFRKLIGGTEGLIERQANAYLERYKFGAEEISNVQVPLGVGFNIDVGDTVIFGANNLNLSDSKSGSKAFGSRVMEVTNKKFPINGGAITLTLLDTQFSIAGRFGSISPSSFIKSASGSQIVLKPSFGQSEFVGEVQKWRGQERQKIKLRSQDFEHEFENFIVSFSGIDTIVLRDPIPAQVKEDYILEIADYDDVRGNRNKAVFAYFNPSVNITSGDSQTVFSVSDASDLFEGATIYVRNDDYSNLSGEVTITNIDTLEITVSQALGFIPASSDKIELIGFVEDSGQPYKII